MLKKAVFGAACLAAMSCLSPGSAQQMPTSWGRCMFNGGWMGVPEASTDQWYRSQAKLQPSGGGARGQCLFGQGKQKVAWEQALKKCG